MVLPEHELQAIRDELSSCKNPLFFFHDDADGLSSFLLLYRYIKEGRGVVVKTRPLVDETFLSKVLEVEPDKIFITDLAMVSDEFIRKVKVPIIWIDHHEPQHPQGNVKYFNPRIHKSDSLVPASQVCYHVVKKDLWIAMCGIVGDWVLSENEARDFKKEYPGLINDETVTPPDALFNSKLGQIIRIMNFVLKGPTKEVNKAIKYFTMIDSPYDILEKKTPEAIFLCDKTNQMIGEYQQLLAKAKKVVAKNKLGVFTYSAKSTSFTGELANELLYIYPEKVIVIGREKNDEIKCSLRSGKKVNLSVALQKALQGIDGYGGGHEQACGASIKKKDFEEFIKNLKNNLP